MQVNNTSAKLLRAVLFATFISCSLACRKDPFIKLEEEKEQSNSITILSPEANSIFHRGDSVKIKASASSASTLHGYTLYLINKGLTDTIFRIESFSHSTHLSIDKFWINSISKRSEMELHLIVNTNDEEGTERKVVPFRCEE